MNPGTIAGTNRRIAILGNHLPPQCGIATFTTDLSGGRGIFVPWRDSQAIARAVVDLLSNDEKRLALCARAAAHVRSMAWPAVARRYLQSFDRACSREQGVPWIARELPVRARRLST